MEIKMFWYIFGLYYRVVKILNEIKVIKLGKMLVIFYYYNSIFFL